MFGPLEVSSEPFGWAEVGALVGHWDSLLS